MITSIVVGRCWCDCLECGRSFVRAMVGVIALSVVGRLLEAMVGVIASSVVGRLLETMVGVIASSVVGRLLEQYLM